MATDINSLVSGGTAPVAKPQSLEALHKDWQKTQDPAVLSRMVGDLSSDIDKAIYAYVGLNAGPTVKTRAKVLAARAIKKYDPKSKASLRSWVYTQLQPLNRYSRELSPSPMPERAFLQVTMLKKLENDFYENYGRMPSDVELADISGSSPKQLAAIRKLNKRTVTESGVAYSGENPSSYEERLGSKQQSYKDDILHMLYSTLSPQEQLIMEHKLGFNRKPVLSNNDIARKLKMSPGRVSQLSNRIAAQLDEYAAVYKGQM